MRTSNRLTAIADALRPSIAALQQLRLDLPTGAVTDAKVEQADIDLRQIVASLDREAAFLRGGND